MYGPPRGLEGGVGPESPVGHPTAYCLKGLEEETLFRLGHGPWIGGWGVLAEGREGVGRPPYGA
jgi:hypothetical protein